MPIDEVAMCREAAERGNTDAQFSLALRYFIGEGVPRDSVLGVVWCRKAADKGHPKAQFHLGWRYSDGDGVPKDDAQAAVWYRRAADQGDADGQCALGDILSKGEGVPQDDAAAAAWYRKAADQGYPDGQYSLSQMYSDGRGVPHDYVQALKWASLGAAHASAYKQSNYAEAREEIAAKVTPSQFAEAQTLSAEWTRAFNRRRVTDALGTFPSSPGGRVWLVITHLAIVGISVLLIAGAEWLSEHLLPWFLIASELALVIEILVVLPLSVFKRCRRFAGDASFVAAGIFGATLWMLALLQTLTLGSRWPGVSWGPTWWMSGLLLVLGSSPWSIWAGTVGVIAVAMLAALFNEMWNTLGQLVLLTVLLISAWFYSFWITGDADATKKG